MPLGVKGVTGVVLENASVASRELVWGEGMKSMCKEEIERRGPECDSQWRLRRGSRDRRPGDRN
jgi:hypothetical protein